MKKILSILLAVLVIATSCICAIPVSAADCSNGHNVTSYTSANNNYHTGVCIDCGKTVKRTHTVEYYSTILPTCEQVGKVEYKCKDCDYTESEVLTSNHNITYTVYKFFLDSNNNPMAQRVDHCGKCNKDIEGEPYAAGATNVCPECRTAAVITRTVYYATCVEGGKTEFNCTACQAIHIKDKTPAVSHIYETVIDAPSCEKDGSKNVVCVNCGDIKEENKLLKMDHRMDKAGTTYTYTYNGTDCEIEGTCAYCNNSFTKGNGNAIPKKNVIPEKCTKCNNSIKTKTVVLPANCEDSAIITYQCSISSCPSVTVEAVPVGHDVKKTTYYYQDGVYDYAEVECNRCGVQVIEDDSFKKDTTCRSCKGNIIDRVVYAPTCTENGYTKVTCSNCNARYTEDSVTKKAHSVTEAAWTYIYDAGLSKYSFKCGNYGCFGDAYADHISIIGTCPNCKQDKKLIDKREVYADCVSAGYISFKCEACSDRSTVNGKVEYSDSEILKSNIKSHSLITLETNATCNNEGNTKTTCKKCYHTEIKNIIPQASHVSDIVTSTFDEVYGKVTTTYTACILCGTKPEDVVETEANLGECKQAGCNSKIKIKEVSRVDCGDKRDGYVRYTCGVGHVITENKIAYSHKYGAWVVEKGATCIAPGSRVKTCIECGDRLVEEISQNTNAAGEPIHNLLVVIEGKAPTCTENGVSAETYCVWCSEVFKSQFLPATGHKTNPLSENPHYCTACNNYIVDEVTETPDGYVKVEMKDANGNVMYQIEGYKVVTNPETGKTVYETDENGNVVLDEYGIPVPVYEKDEYGNRIPIYRKDDNGNKIPIYKLTPCNCIHHNNAPLGQVFFKILIFFCQILGLNRVCGCGEVHY